MRRLNIPLLWLTGMKKEVVKCCRPPHHHHHTELHVKLSLGIYFILEEKYKCLRGILFCDGLLVSSCPSCFTHKITFCRIKF